MLKGWKMMWKWWKTWRTLPVYSWVKAASLYREGNFELAREYYEKGLRKNPRHSARFCARMDLAYCLFRARRFEEAECHLRHVVKRLPQSREANLRLARLQVWTGNYLEAAYTLKRASEYLGSDGELVALFLLAVLENGGPNYLLKDAVTLLLKLDSQVNDPRLEVARATLALQKGEVEKGRAVLATAAAQVNAPLEAHVQFCQVLLDEGRVAHARRQLRRAMAAAPEHPRLLNLFAETYLQPGPFYNPEFAKQLGTAACQNSGWLSPREMHTLAQAFYHIGDRMAALIVASKAKQVGKQRLGGAYRDSDTLDQLIETLSTGTLA